MSRNIDALPPSALDDLVALAAAPVEDFSRAAVVAMLGHGVADLIDAGLVVTVGRGRLRVPEFVRQYALRLPNARSVDVGQAAERLFAFYLRTVRSADFADDPDRLRTRPEPAGEPWSMPGVRPLDWLEADAVAIAAMIRWGHHCGRFDEVIRLCGAMDLLPIYRGHHWLVLDVNDYGLLAAEILNDRVAMVHLHAQQGRILTLLRMFDRADNALSAAEQMLSGQDDARLRSSVMERRARWAEESGDLARAVDLFRSCVAVDRQHNLRRALGIHLRMLANVLRKADRPKEALELVASAQEFADHPRNAGRLHTVAARVQLDLGDLDQVRIEAARARQLVTEAGATQYEVELSDIEAHLAQRTGDVEGARTRWGWITRFYYEAGDDPRFVDYLEKFNQLPPAPR